MNPVIVVCAYDRPHLLFRLLASIERSKYLLGTKLIVSVDHSDMQSDVVSALKEFRWIYGDFEVIAHSVNLGLREHILFCGALTKQYGSIVLLEEDLYVSPMFYKFSLDALKFYKGCKKVSGISLYNQEFCETSQMKFHKIDESDSDVYFLQVASSWGQVWTKGQWLKFEQWYHSNDTWPNEASLPHNLHKWPESSWKKYFIRYNVENELYFVYPRVSLTTNFCDSGTHHKRKQPRFQVPLEQNLSKLWSFASFDKEIAIYDAHCELSPESLVEFCGLNIDSNDLEVDLYGQKNLSTIDKKYLISVRQSSSPLKTYALDLKPRELNLKYQLEGNQIVFAETSTFEDVRTINRSTEQEYYFGIPVY